MQTNPIQSISFSGLKIAGTISSKNIKKLNEITKKFEEYEFIDNLENNFDTDIVLNSEFDTISFFHKRYGSLSKYIKPSLVENLLSRVQELTTDIKIAIRKTEKDSFNSKSIYDALKRGC